MKPEGIAHLAALLSFLIAFCPPNFRAGEPGAHGIYLNLSADAVLIEPKWKHTGKKGNKELGINSSSKEEVITALYDYIDSYVGTQVRGLFFNINYQRACFDSNVMESYWELTDPEKEITGWPRLHWAVKKKEIDPFEICVKRCRHDDLSPWISIRMNDHHYFDIPARINSMWLDHPEYRTRPPHGLFNYAKKEVRNYYKAFIQEILDTYDVDGIELDWMRTHHLFPGGEAARGMKLIDEFMREIRVMTEKMAQERGHPVKVAARVPSRPDIGRHFGLDAVTWAKQGSIDLLIPSNWFTPTNFDLPIELWKQELGSETPCLVAAGADATFCVAKNKYVKQMQATSETMRGFAVSAYSRGADAVYIFNNFLSPYRLKTIEPDGTVSHVDSKQETLREIGHLSTSLGKPRTHVLTYTDPDIKPTPPNAPALPPKKSVKFKIHIGPKPEKGNCVIHVGLDSRPGIDQAQLSVKVNGTSCQQLQDVLRDPKYTYDNMKVWHVVRHVSETGARVMRFQANLNDLTNGYNHISVTNNQKEEQSLTWLEIHLN